MTIRKFIDDLREQHSHHPSLEAQIKVFAAHHWRATTPGEAGPDLGKRDMDQTLDAMGLELQSTLDTAVDNLLTAGLLDSYEPDGPDWFQIRERDGEFVMGEKFPPAVQEECERAIEHIQSMDPSDDDGATAVADGGHRVPRNPEGETLREEISDVLDLEPSELETWLEVGDAQMRRGKLERLVEAIKESETFDLPTTFDEVRLIPKGYRYHRSEAVLDA